MSLFELFDATCEGCGRRLPCQFDIIRDVVACSPKCADAAFQRRGAKNEGSGCPTNDDREGGRPVAPPEIGVPASSPLAVGAGQTGETITVCAGGDRLLETDAAPASVAGAPLRNVIEKREDGFYFDGVRYADAEGRLVLTVPLRYRVQLSEMLAARLEKP